MPFTAPAPANTAPDIGNYFIGRGYAQIQLPGDVTWHDLGNITVFEFQVKPTMLPHFSSRVGVRKKDFTAVTELDATLTMSMEEFTARNMGFALLGTVQGTSPNFHINIMDTPALYASFQFTGTNTIGPQWQASFPTVLITPQKAISLISAGAGTWGTIDVQGDVLFDAHSQTFGTLSVTHMGP
jgi:hypothetical protein